MTIRDYLVVLAVLSLAACATNSPSSPSRFSADIRSVEGSTKLLGCAGGSCGFEGEARNHGPGCADNVRGLTRLLDAEGREIGRAEWALDPSRAIGYQEAFLFGRDALEARFPELAAPTFSTDFAWDEVDCS